MHDLGAPVGEAIRRSVIDPLPIVCVNSVFAIDALRCLVLIKVSLAREVRQQWLIGTLVHVSEDHLTHLFQPRCRVRFSKPIECFSIGTQPYVLLQFKAR